MTNIELMEKIKGELGESLVEITQPSERRIFLTVDPKELVVSITVLRDRMGITFLSTISGVDRGDSFELLYHFADGRSCYNVRTRIPRENPHVDSISPVIPGALLYEREIQDMFGIAIDNIPDPRPLLTPDDWPPGNYPLRKDWKFERPEEKIPGGRL